MNKQGQGQPLGLTAHLRQTGQRLGAAYAQVYRTPLLRRLVLVGLTLLTIVVIHRTPGLRESNVAAWLIYVVAVTAYAPAREALLGLLVATGDGGLLLHQALTQSLLPHKTFIFIAALGAFALAGLLLIGLNARTRRAQEAVRLAQQQAAQAARARAEFLSSASHDLRTPLTVLLGLTSLLQTKLHAGGTLSAEWLDRQVGLLHANATQMQHLLDEMADAAQLTSGDAVALHREAVNLVELVQRVVGGAQATPQGASRTIRLVGPAAVVVTADAARLQRVVQNLLDNALKYSAAPAPVLLTVEEREQAVVLRVRDEGIGIPAAELAHVATYAYRATTARRQSGMGIGLAGARHLVDLHGGSLTIASVEGAGTTVTVTLPRDDVGAARAHDDRAAEAS